MSHGKSFISNYNVSSGIVVFIVQDNTRKLLRERSFKYGYYSMAIINIITNVISRSGSCNIVVDMVAVVGVLLMMFELVLLFLLLLLLEFVVCCASLLLLFLSLPLFMVMLWWLLFVVIFNGSLG